MAKSKPFKILREKMSPEARERAQVRTQRMLLEMDLQALREHVAELTQVEVADILRVTQAHVSKLEHREDMLVSTLRKYVEGLGGHLEILARFGKRTVRIKSPADLEAIDEGSAQSA